MTNFRAIAVVTESIRYLLYSSVKVAGLSDYSVKIGPPPKTPPDAPVINLYLYQVSPIAQLRNADLPTRDSWGRLIEDPKVYLDLDYLISFTGIENTVEAELMLGSALRTLHAVPEITPEQVREMLEWYKDQQPKHHDKLEASDLTDPVRLSQLTLTTDERSRLWSVFFQVPYRLSVEFRASMVAIPADLATIEAPAVRQVQPTAGPMERPR